MLSKNYNDLRRFAQSEVGIINDRELIFRFILWTSRLSRHVASDNCVCFNSNSIYHTMQNGLRICEYDISHPTAQILLAYRFYNFLGTF